MYHTCFLNPLKDMGVPPPPPLPGVYSQVSSHNHRRRKGQGFGTRKDWSKMHVPHPQEPNPLQPYCLSMFVCTEVAARRTLREHAYCIMV